MAHGFLSPLEFQWLDLQEPLHESTSLDLVARDHA